MNRGKGMQNNKKNRIELKETFSIFSRIKFKHYVIKWFYIKIIIIKKELSLRNELILFKMN